jgi:hypothetical protein
MDLNGLPPEILYALIEMLSGGIQDRPGQQYQQQPTGPNEMEAFMRYLQTMPPPNRMQVDPTRYRELVDYGQNPWGNVEPGR